MPERNRHSLGDQVRRTLLAVAFCSFGLFDSKVSAQNYPTWEYSESIVSETGERIVQASLRAAEVDGFAFKPILLVVRCVGGEAEAYVDWNIQLSKGTDPYFSSDKKQFYSPIGQYAGPRKTVKFRFGERKAYDEPWALVLRNEATLFHLPRLEWPWTRGEYLRLMEQEKTFIVRVKALHRGEITAVFYTADIDRGTSRVRKGCKGFENIRFGQRR